MQDIYPNYSIIVKIKHKKLPKTFGQFHINA